MTELTTVTFKWEEETYEDFKQTFVQMQADGEIPNDMTRSELIREILEDWMENPDSAVLSGD